MNITELFLKAFTWKRVPYDIEKSVVYRNLIMVRFMIILHFIIGLDINVMFYLVSKIKGDAGPAQGEMPTGIDHVVVVLFLAVASVLLTLRPSTHEKIKKRHKVCDVLAVILFLFQLGIIYFKTYMGNSVPFIIIIFLILMSVLVIQSVKRIFMIYLFSIILIIAPAIYYKQLYTVSFYFAFSVNLILVIAAVIVSIITLGTNIYLYEEDIVIKEQKEDLERVNSMLQGNVDELERLSSIDPLTGIENRRVFDIRFDRECKRAQRNKSELGLIMLDIDFFKLYNDNYGHQQGDECLKKIAAAVRDCVHRPIDLVARYGGEEFVIILPETNLNGLRQVGETICNKVRKLKIPHRLSPFGIVTVSLGCVISRAGFRDECEKILNEADRGLYQSKNNGRNRLTVRYYE